MKNNLSNNKQHHQSSSVSQGRKKSGIVPKDWKLLQLANSWHTTVGEASNKTLEEDNIIIMIV
jgi:hypothetical protein